MKLSSYIRFLFLFLSLNSFIVNSTNSLSRPEIKLNLTDGTSSKFTEVYYINGATTGFDNGLDGEVFGGVSASFSVHTRLVDNSNTNNYAIQSIPPTNTQNYVIPIGVKASSGKQLVFTVNATNIPAGINVFLEDRVTNTFTRLDLANSNYTVTINTDLDGVGRFFLYTTSAIFTGNTDASWSTGSNWSSNSLPGNTDIVTIPSNKTVDVNTNVNSKSIAVFGAINVPHNFSVVINENLFIEGGFTINSSLNSSGSLLVKGTSEGEITYKRSITANKWHLLSSPVDNETFDATFFTENSITSRARNNLGIATYKNDGSSWNYIQSGTSGNFIIGKGYSFLSSGSNITFKGTVKTDNLASLTITENANNAWNLIGNPYPSFLAINTSADATNNFLSVNSSQLDPAFVAIYVWNAVSEEYQLINNVTGSTLLAPGQGFFVNAKNGGGTIQITEAMQKSSSNNVLFKNENIEVELKVRDKDNQKTTKILYLENATTGLDIGYDAGLFGGVSSKFSVFSHLVSNNDNIPFTLQCLPNKDFEEMVIPIGITSDSDKEIVFTVNSFNIPNEFSVYLEDKNYNTFTKLNAYNLSYKTNILKNEDGNLGRFYLHLKSKVLSTNDYKFSKVKIIYLKEKKILRIEGLSEKKNQIKIFSVLGKEVFTSSFVTSEVKIPRLSSGIYIVEVSSSSRKIRRKMKIE